MDASHAWRAVQGIAAALRRGAAILFAVAALAGLPAHADPLADFNAAVERASSHNRVALGYLRTGNTDLAALEIERARTAWREFIGSFAAKRPPIFKDVTRYTTVLTDVSTRLVAADMMLTMGRPALAAQSLMAIRIEIANLRQSVGVDVLPDCILRANAEMETLTKFDKDTLDLADEKTRKALAEQAQRYGAQLRHCDGIAGDDVRTQSTFRRLVDGAKTSLALIPEAIAQKDSGRIHRILDELRAIDNLLSFRFG
ncbi:MAG TPA: hypothetical protein VFL51_17665 [Pseudolabrys sp.]|nr:hypothetical protein [Pseudolabrys sp.]